MAWTISNAMMRAYENSLCSQGRGAESLEATCSDGAQSAQSSTTPTPDQYYWPDKTTEHSRLSRFGMTCVPLTEGLGAAVLTWFLVDFPVRTSALQALEPELTESEAGYGGKWPGSFAKLNQDSSLWKTAQHSLLGGLAEFSQTWPRWGLMLDGECWELDISALGIYENEFGYSLPTIGKNEYRGSSQNRFRGSAAFRGAKMVEGVRVSRTDPTYLTPWFAELAMWWPTTWTELAALETGKFQQWRQQHGISFQTDSKRQKQE